MNEQQETVAPEPGQILAIPIPLDEYVAMNRALNDAADLRAQLQLAQQALREAVENS